MKRLIVAALLGVFLVGPAAAAGWKLTARYGNAQQPIWKTAQAKKNGEALINAGANKEDQGARAMWQFIACVVELGTRIQVMNVHTIGGYADVIVTSGPETGCVGVVDTFAYEKAE